MDPEVVRNDVVVLTDRHEFVVHTSHVEVPVDACDFVAGEGVEEVHFEVRGPHLLASMCFNLNISDYM